MADAYRRKMPVTGKLISLLGLGGAQIGGLYHKNTDEEYVAMIQDAYKSGINYFDMAYFYGQGKCETLYGRALKALDAPRDSYAIATKVCRYEFDEKTMFDFSAAKTRVAIDQALERLGLDYVDVLFVHDPEFADIDMVLTETLPELQKAKDAGKCRAIGVASYVLKVLKEIVEKSPVKIDVVQTVSRYTLLDQSLNDEMHFFKSRGIEVTNVGVLCMGLLSTVGGLDFHAAPAKIKMVANKALQMCQLRGLNISSMAIKYALLNEDILVTVVGCNYRDQVPAAVEIMRSYQDGWSPEEELFLRDLEAMIVEEMEGSPMNWEDKKIEEYMKDMFGEGNAKKE